MNTKLNVGVLLVLKMIGFVAGMSSRITNGRNANNGEIPFQVSLRDSSNHHICGGVILDQNWVITAAHCLRNHHASNIKIIYNTLDIFAGEEIEASKIIIHFNYFVKEISYNDIGLIRTVKPMKLGRLNAKSLVLAKQGHDPEPGSKVTISGWGLGNGYTRQRFLQITKVPIISRTQCRKKTNKYNHNVTEAMFCTEVEEDRKSTCFGDSGGPATIDGKVLVGIISWGYAKCGTPSKAHGLTRIGFFRDWITNNTGI